VIATPEERGLPLLQIFHTGMCRTQQTSFSFDPTAHQDAYAQLLLEPCGHHGPPSDESLTSPFYPDPSQRVLSVYFSWGVCCVINVEALLELARDRAGEDIRWDEWGADTIEVHVGELEKVAQTWVSGCRLFSVARFEGEKEGAIEPCCLRIFDLSPAGRGKHLESKVDGGEMKRWVSPGLGGHRLPWEMEEVWDVTTGHDTITFHIVSVLIFLSTSSWLNKGFVLAPPFRLPMVTRVPMTNCMCGVCEDGGPSIVKQSLLEARGNVRGYRHGPLTRQSCLNLGLGCRSPSPPQLVDT